LNEYPTVKNFRLHTSVHISNTSSLSTAYDINGQCSDCSLNAQQRALNYRFLAAVRK